MIGQTIAQYEILDQLGMGGMGIVYRAKDTNLGRIVALKFLPQNTLVSDDDRARFRREAQAAASLNHPNICTIHDLGETDDGNTYIAMEYVDGPTLKQEIETAPMKLDRAIDITVQVAKGLHAAHSVDIVHRDVKSANIMLNAEGQVKIMDFGLAKTAQSTQLTKTGSTLGTFTFMSPEQARGDEVDRRTDIWSLGVVLYELVTGRLPFGGEYEQAMVYSILNQDPEPLTSLRIGVPVALDWIMAKLLAKDPGRRYQSANEAAIDLQSIDLQATGLSSVSMISNMSGVSQAPQAVPSDPLQTAPAVTGSQRSGLPKYVVPTAVLLALLSGLVGWLLKPTPSVPPGQVVRFSVPLPAGVIISNQGRHAVAVSPDGKYYAFVANEEIYLGELASGEPASLVAGSAEGREVFFSPDSRWLGFEYSSGDATRIMKASVLGGNPMPLAETASVYGSNWSSNKWIYLGQGSNGILRIPENGGDSEVVVTPDSGTVRARYNQPQLLPDNIHLLYSKLPVNAESWDESVIEILNVESGAITRLDVNGNDARYLQEGYLLYGHSGTIYAASLDIASLRLGAPVPVAEGVFQAVVGNAGPIQFSVSETGLMSWLPLDDRDVNSGWNMIWVDASGNETPIFSDEGIFITPKLSSDGTRITVFHLDDNEPGIKIFDVIRGAPVNLAPDYDTKAIGAIWGPEDEHVAFAAANEEERHAEIWIRDSNLGSQPKRLFEFDEAVGPESWSLDGRYLAFTQIANPNGDILIYDFESDSVSAFLATAADEFQASFSPDGNWIAYSSNVTSVYEVYIQPFPGPGGISKVSTAGGSSPVWSSDGTTIYYVTEEDEIYGVDVTLNSTPQLGIPVKIYGGSGFATSWVFRAAWGSIEVDPVNSRFIMMSRPRNAESDGPETDELRFVVNWFEELKEKIPPLE